MAGMSGFDVMREDSWRIGHEIATLRKPLQS
jgi:hypothetical protein